MMFNLGTVSTKRLYRMIAERIAEKIAAGEFSVGERLPAERELAELLQVSRSSVREALIALELSGYIEVRVGSGIFVIASGASTAAARAADDGVVASLVRIANDVGPFDLLETRLLVEPECAAHAAHKGSPEHLPAIGAAWEAMSLTDAPHDADRAFHAAIAAACGNAALEAVVLHVADLSAASPMYRRLDSHFVDAEVWNIALAEHQRIAGAILDRDPIRARHAMYAHLLAIMARMREQDLSGREAPSRPDGAVRSLRRAGEGRRRG